MIKNPTGGPDQQIYALKQLQILDTQPEAEFDSIAVLAARLCGMPCAFIGFTDEHRIWLKARHGMDSHFQEIPAGVDFCRKVHHQGKVSFIPDVSENEALTGNPSMIEYGIRSLASAELEDENGTVVGYLCVFDTKPRILTEEQRSSLGMLAAQASALLRLRSQLIQDKEREYRESEKQMSTIFRNSIDAVVVTDSRDTILQWNAKAESIFGWKTQEVVGKRFGKLCNVKISFDDFAGETRSTILGQKHDLGRAVEATALDKQGNTLEVALSISPANIYDRAYYIIFISDITERKFAARELDRQKEFYENILNNIPTDIAVFDTDHRYLFVNPTAIKNPELRQYIIGKDDFEYSQYRKRDDAIAKLRREKFLEAKEKAREIRWEDSVETPEGAVYTHLRRMFPVHDENGSLSMVIGFGVDITDRKELEEKQSALLKQLSVQNTQLIDFCNIVSHNLRAPLVNISLLVEFIETCGEPEEQRQLISKLNPVLENLNTTFNELVESIQIRQDLEIQSERIVLEDYILRTLESLEQEINKSGAVIEVDIEAAPELRYPAKYINSILQNLVSNSLKYQSPDRSPHIQIATIRSGNRIILSVKDNGLGIDLKRHKDSLFKIGKVFHHHPNAKGFGLFMVKTHIESMGGRIWLESAPDQGTTFFVEFINQHAR